MTLRPIPTPTPVMAPWDFEGESKPWAIDRKSSYRDIQYSKQQEKTPLVVYLSSCLGYRGAEEV
jgi:hypothetical protein